MTENAGSRRPTGPAEREVTASSEDLAGVRRQHPGDYQQDLNPHELAGENYGIAGPHPEKAGLMTADDIKGLHGSLKGFTGDELKAIPVLPQGARLEQGATYLDLQHLERGDFTARGDMQAGPDNYYVPKTDVGYVLWNRLLGVTNPERLDQA